MLEQYFQFKRNNTSIKTEVIGGLTTFLTMVYIVFVNPSILSATGMDSQAVFITTCIIAAVGSIGMGLFANLPVALAPAMGLNAFFAFFVVQKLGLSWQVGMGTIFWGATGLFILTIFKVRYWLMANIPICLRIGITAGIGLFIAFIGLKNGGIVVSDQATLVTLGNIKSIPVLLSMLSFLIIIILAAYNIHIAVLLSVFITTILGYLFTSDITYHGIFSIPTGITKVVGQVDLVNSFDLGLLGIIFSFMLVNLFDSSGTLLGVTEKAGLTNEKGIFPNMNKALLVDSTSSMLGAYLGTSAVTAYIESNAGVSVGAKTGFSAVICGLLFLLIIFLSPLANMVPPYATSGALIYVGVLMTSILVKIQWEDLTEAAPAFITAIMMPFSYSITDGIACGFLAYCIIKTFTGKINQISISVWVIALLFLVKFYI